MVITIHTGVGAVTTIRIGVMLMADIIHIMEVITHTTVEDIMQGITETDIITIDTTEEGATTDVFIPQRQEGEEILTDMRITTTVEITVQVLVVHIPHLIQTAEVIAILVHITTIEITLLLQIVLLVVTITEGTIIALVHTMKEAVVEEIEGAVGLVQHGEIISLF